MKFLIFLFLIFTATAQAEHHRGHAVMHLDNAILRMSQSIDFAKSYRDLDAAGLLPADQRAEYKSILGLYDKKIPCPYIGLVRPDGHCIAAFVGEKRKLYPRADFPEWNVAYDHMFHANKYDIYGSKYLDRIKKARAGLANGEDLDVTRRLLNAPGMNGQLDSGVWGIIQTQSSAQALVRDDSPNLRKVAKILSLNRVAAGTVTWAIWHNTDAIREEIYLDRAFICSGPNNHCQ